MSFFEKGKINTEFALMMYKKSNEAALKKGLEAIGADEIASELEKLFSPILMKKNLLDE